MWCSTHRRRLVHRFRSENGPRRRRTLGGLSDRVRHRGNITVLRRTKEMFTPHGRVKSSDAFRVRRLNRPVCGTGSTSELASLALRSPDPAFRVVVPQTGRLSRLTRNASDDLTRPCGVNISSVRRSTVLFPLCLTRSLGPPRVRRCAGPFSDLNRCRRRRRCGRHHIENFIPIQPKRRSGSAGESFFLSRRHVRSHVLKRRC